MLGEHSCLRANDREVAAKTVDGEAILINLSNGLYYSTGNVGAYIWSMLAAGCSVARLVECVCADYGVAAEQARPDVGRLVQELLEEGLILQTEEAPAASPPPAAPQRPVYEPPRLVKYDDMADMFALDPPLPELPAAPRSERS